MSISFFMIGVLLTIVFALLLFTGTGYVGILFGIITMSAYYFFGGEYFYLFPAIFFILFGIYMAFRITDLLKEMK